MSHFSVMVVGNDVEYQLAPFHEYECTGVDDEFVIDVDVTDETRADYETDTVHGMVQRPDGSLIYPWDREGNYVAELSPFYDPVDRKLNLPEGWSKPEGKFFSKDYVSIEDWAPHWNGAEMGGDGRLYRHTNPNAQWDWWVEGGRWSDFLLLKDGTKANSAKVSEVDWDGMRRESELKAEGLFDSLEPFHPWRSFAEIKEAHLGDLDQARDIYLNQPGRMWVKEVITNPFFDVDELLVGREAYVRRKANAAVTTFAFLKDREWTERGSMGWFGIVTDEKPQEDWNEAFWAQIQTLSGDDQITIVDCHI